VATQVAIPNPFLCDKPVYRLIFGGPRTRRTKRGWVDLFYHL